MRGSQIQTLEAINRTNMIFISAQPDTVYFHWQVEIYLYQFALHGIKDRCYALFGYIGDGPSAYVQGLTERYPNVISYSDDRGSDEPYSPTIRPHLLKKFFKEYPELGANVFYHDSDILLVKLPRFELMLNDDISYLSDTISYIGYEYLKNSAQKYRNKYPQLPVDDIFNKMCRIVDIEPALVIANQNNSGGAQYLLKNIDHAYWEEVEEKCVHLYDFIASYEKKYKINQPIQKWTTDMWVVLWLYWKHGGKTLIHPELNFSWATNNITAYHSNNIFHLAGITHLNEFYRFSKTKFKKINVFEAYSKYPYIFDNIDKNNATYEYVKVLLQCYKNVIVPNNIFVTRQTKTIKSNTCKGVNLSAIDNVTKFKLSSGNIWDSIYTIDARKLCCGKPIWRSINNKYIIFHNMSSWILTYSHYENVIGKLSGGLASSDSDEPYINEWNHVASITILG